MAKEPSQDAAVGITPDSEGRKIGQAEYLLLKCLGELEPVSKDSLERRLRLFSEDLKQQGIDNRIQFAGTTGYVSDQSREFNEVLSRCRRWGLVDRTLDRTYRLTSDGREHIETLESDDQYRINGQFDRLFNSDPRP